jgi:hypothetical protein
LSRDVVEGTWQLQPSAALLFSQLSFVVPATIRAMPRSHRRIASPVRRSFFSTPVRVWMQPLHAVLSSPALTTALQ